MTDPVYAGEDEFGSIPMYAVEFVVNVSGVIETSVVKPLVPLLPKVRVLSFDP